MHTAPTPRERLEGFCCPDPYEHRTSLRAPWSLNGFAYAANGHWMVRMPLDGLGELTPWTPRTHPANIEQRFQTAAFERLQPMPLVPCNACDACKGLGRVVETICSSCDGKGEFVHAGLAYPCQLCDETGKEHRPAGAGDSPTHMCVQCTGTGFDFHQSGTSTIDKFQDGYFQRAYLAALSRLPGIQFGTCPADGDNFQPAAFRFDGGEGLLMPCRPPVDGGPK